MESASFGEDLSETPNTDGGIGAIVVVDESSLEAESLVVNSAKEAYEICERLVSDWDKGIENAAKITAKLNGERPYNQRTLANQGKKWKTNISTGFLSSECGKIPPRFYMPVMGAKYLTAAQLPTGWPNGVEKTQHFRQIITDTIRGWNKWNFFLRGMAREVGIFGVGYAAYFDKYEWRPSLIRMDKGFVPTGTEIMDEDIPFFCCKWDYKPSELLALLKQEKEAGLSNWDTEAAVRAINNAMPVATSTDDSNERTYEELIRQSVEAYSYSKSARVIETYHLFAKEYNGEVSHIIILRSDPSKPDPKNGTSGSSMLYLKKMAYPSMKNVCVPLVFDYGDGTIHGAWGAGQILYDMAVQVEKIRNDSIDNLRNQNKAKIQVNDAKDVNQVKLVVNDTMMIVSGGQFNGSSAALPQNVDGYMALDQQMTRLAQEKIGAYVPPIPLSPSDVKAAQVNAAMQKEQEVQQALLDNWLSQIAKLISAMTSRLCDPLSPDPAAKRCLELLKKVLTDEEIGLLSNQPALTSITEFTQFAAQQRAMFAASKSNNALYNQRALELVQAEAAGGMHFAEYVLLPQDDQSVVLAAQRQQVLENAAMAQGMPVPVLPQDNDWIHAQTMEQPLLQVLQAGNYPVARIGLQHYVAHYTQGVSKKQWPKDQINESKKRIAEYEKALIEGEQRAAAEQQMQQAQQPPQ